jgi:hypothetical protein
MMSGCSPCSRRCCRRWCTARKPGPGPPGMTSSTAGCWTGHCPGCRRRMPPGSGTPAPAGGGCRSRSTRPPIPGRTRGAPRAGSTSTTVPVTAGVQQDHPGLGVPARRRHRVPAHRLGSGRRAADDSRHPDDADGRAGQGRAAPPARQRGGAAVRLRRRLQRRRPDRRAGRLPRRRPGPAPAGSVFYQDAPSWPGKNIRTALRAGRTGGKAPQIDQSAISWRRT